MSKTLWNWASTLLALLARRKRGWDVATDYRSAILDIPWWSNPRICRSYWRSVCSWSEKPYLGHLGHLGTFGCQIWYTCLRKSTRSWTIDPMKAFTSAMKVLTSIRCTILKVAAVTRDVHSHEDMMTLVQMSRFVSRSLWHLRTGRNLRRPCMWSFSLFSRMVLEGIETHHQVEWFWIMFKKDRWGKIMEFKARWVATLEDFGKPLVLRTFWSNTPLHAT